MSARVEIVTARAEDARAGRAVSRALRGGGGEQLRHARSHGRMCGSAPEGRRPVDRFGASSDRSGVTRERRGRSSGNRPLAGRGSLAGGGLCGAGSQIPNSSCVTRSGSPFSDSSDRARTATRGDREFPRSGRSSPEKNRSNPIAISRKVRPMTTAGFELVCEIEPPTRPDLKHVRHQIGVLSSVAGTFLIPDNHIGRATVSSVAVAHEVEAMGGTLHRLPERQRPQSARAPAGPADGCGLRGGPVPVRLRRRAPRRVAGRASSPSAPC